jgi:hypothetical protein
MTNFGDCGQNKKGRIFDPALFCCDGRSCCILTVCSRDGYRYGRRITVVLAVIPQPAGLSQHAWWYFSLFAGVVAALVVEPLPPAAIGFIAIALTAGLSHWTLFGTEDLAKPSWRRRHGAFVPTTLTVDDRQRSKG